MRYLFDAASEEEANISRRTIKRVITVGEIFIASFCVKNLFKGMLTNHYYASATSDVDQLIYLRLCLAMLERDVHDCTCKKMIKYISEEISLYKYFLND